MDTTSKASERFGIVGVINPDANAAGTLLTGAIDMSRWGRIVAIVQSGDLGTNGTLDFSFTQAPTSGGSYIAISPAKAITQLTEAGTDSNKEVVLELRADELTEGYRYVKGSFVTATATGDSSAVVLGFDPRFTPVTDIDLSTVDEIV